SISRTAVSSRRSRSRCAASRSMRLLACSMRPMIQRRSGSHHPPDSSLNSRSRQGISTGDRRPVKVEITSDEILLARRSPPGHVRPSPPARTLRRLNVLHPRASTAWPLLAGLLAALAALAAPGARADGPPNAWAFQDHDRIVLVGDTLIERDQRYG